MQRTLLLQYNYFYHIYNRGINGENLFKEDENYQYFLRLYKKHIYPIADTYSWCLMKNHFHFLVKIRDENIIKLNTNKTLLPHRHFSNLFNAYTKAINKRYLRHGSLFERAFRRKEVTDENYLRKLVIYIHHNPIHHKFCDDINNYKWSSFNSFIKNGNTLLKRDEVLTWFADIENFKDTHINYKKDGVIIRWLDD